MMNTTLGVTSTDRALTALGFAGSSEVREAGIGNLGLHDREYFLRYGHGSTSDYRFSERLGLQWVQQYISSFGGDSSKVTMSD